MTLFELLTNLECTLLDWKYENALLGAAESWVRKGEGAEQKVCAVYDLNTIYAMLGIEGKSEAQAKEIIMSEMMKPDIHFLHTSLEQDQRAELDAFCEKHECHNILLANFLDDALIGIAARYRQDQPTAYYCIYDKEKIIDSLMNEDGMEFDEANEYAAFNIYGGFVGNDDSPMPIFVENTEALEFFLISD